jgi:hypothetical protein
VLDTSFWVLAYRAEIAANCLDIFDIVVPDALADEILSRDSRAPTREYPYTTLFVTSKTNCECPTSRSNQFPCLGGARPRPLL